MPLEHTVSKLLKLTSFVSPYRSLNLNQFKGTIPASVGLLSNLYWFDIADNQIGGNIPISNGTSPGLDMLLELLHFHFGKNKLSGEIPEKLFSSNMTLIHMLFDGNQFTGKIPDSLSLVKSLAVLRLDRNKLSGDIPSSLNNLTNLNELYLANNRLTGSLPNLASYNSLYTLYVSNNTLEFSVIPSWLSSLRFLSTLRMEGIQLEGPIPIFLFSPTELQTINLKRNGINETLDFGTNYSEQLEFVDLQSNDITHYRPTSSKRIQVLLANNPVCMELGNEPSYCSIVKHNSSFSTLPLNCAPCVMNKTTSPTCQCVYPITGTLFFRSPSFSGFFNSTNFMNLQQGMVEFFKKFVYPVESVAIRNIREDTTDRQLLIDLLVFPLGKISFNQTEMAILGFAFSNQTYKPPKIFGPYIFQANPYSYFSDVGGASEVGKSKSLSTGGIVGIVFGAVGLLLLIAFGIWISPCCKKREQKNKGKGASDRINHQQVRVTETETETVRVKSRITEL
ncbi:PREDICTED: probable leucine-rich repeat receptor-like protein kinase At5g49770 [Camelina sativa]|uniref:Probable leucine-rich repeat receptor-like protein kinase At5g49770 n=1 Tax=Camelina sativa TaxID=90675 RepID=A0ABM1R671_CAMSA|nr:PREDICTED: probable leucine-rich repeat receptor-like protein kinase At5g49770 [Camelina sativa]